MERLTHVFSDGGWKAEVEILEEKTCAHGTETVMKIIKIHVRPSSFHDPETLLKEGDLFTAWRSHDVEFHRWTTGGQ